MMRLLPPMKRERPIMKTVYAQVYQDVCLRVSRAFDGFFRRVKEKKEDAGYPRYRSVSRYDSFTYPQSGFILSKDHLILSPGKQRIRIRGYRKMDGRIKTCTVIRKGCGPDYRWEAAITYETEKRNVDDIAAAKGGRSIGIDMGLSKLIVTSEGKEYPNGKEFIKAERQLSKILRKMSKYEKGTPERERYRQRLFHAFENIHNKRKGKIYEIVNELIERYDMIFIEDLEIRKMMDDSKGKGMRKSYRDAGWRKFLFVLGYKAEEAGVTVRTVDPAYTSQRCSECGTLVPKDLSIRRHQCPCCGLDVDRD